MTKLLFQQDAYQKTCHAKVTTVEYNRIQFDQTVFYPLGGGQPGDSGMVIAEDGTTLKILDTRKSADGSIDHILSENQSLPLGAEVELRLDWERRYAHMRMHTCLHLLGAVIPHGVTGGNISATRSRLDFDMQDGIDKESVTAELNCLIQQGSELLTHWISGSELAKKPDLIRTLSVKPPMDAPQIRLLEVPNVDLQPCGGTHVKNTSEIGQAMIGKVEKKGKHNRRVYVQLVESKSN